MTAALALLGYAAVGAWLAPALLTPLTSRGLSVRGGLAAWLAAMASVLAAAALAVQFSLRTVAADWPRLTQALCRSVAGGACTPAVYRSVLYQAGIAALALLLTLAAAVAAARYARRVRRSRALTRSHARTALLVGRVLGGTVLGGAVFSGAVFSGTVRPAAGARTVVLDDPRPAAYCAAGRPAAGPVPPATTLSATTLPATRLAAAAQAVPARVDRLLAAPRPAAAGRAAALLTALAALLVAIPPALTALLG